MKNLILLFASAISLFPVFSQSTLDEYKTGINEIGVRMKVLQDDETYAYLFEGMFNHFEAKNVLDEAQRIIDEFAPGNKHNLTPYDLIDMVDQFDYEDQSVHNFIFPNEEFLQVGSQNMGNTHYKYVRMVFKPHGEN